MKHLNVKLEKKKEKLSLVAANRLFLLLFNSTQSTCNRYYLFYHQFSVVAVRRIPWRRCETVPIATKAVSASKCNLMETTANKNEWIPFECRAENWITTFVAGMAEDGHPIFGRKFHFPFHCEAGRPISSVPKIGPLFTLTSTHSLYRTCSIIPARFGRHSLWIFLRYNYLSIHSNVTFAIARHLNVEQGRVENEANSRPFNWRGRCHADIFAHTEGIFY